MKNSVFIIGAGLAGCEAALQLADRGIKVTLFESKPLKKSPAHRSDGFAELVCSNSLKSDDEATSSGLLKRELQMLSCRLLKIAEGCRVPAGSALAVDRELFSLQVTRAIRENPNIEVQNSEVTQIEDSVCTILATGPLTHDALATALEKKLGSSLHFYDAAAPIVSAESIDMRHAFLASRYDKGESDYINCPLNREQYEIFYDELVHAESVQLKEFEKNEIFEGCMPVEIMARRGKDAIRFGPLKPVGFTDPETGRRFFAVVQLRKENVSGTAYNLVGFQTNLKFPEQKRVFGLIPALKNAEFLRYGVMHRNTFINAPKTLNGTFQARQFPNLFIAGQLSGVEGYVESIMSGLLAALNAYAFLKNAPMLRLPQETICGALTAYLEQENENFQPMNANFGLLPPLQTKEKDKRARKLLYTQRSLKSLEEFKKGAPYKLIFE